MNTNNPAAQAALGEGQPGIVVTNEVDTVQAGISCVQELADAAVAEAEVRSEWQQSCKAANSSYGPGEVAEMIRAFGGSNQIMDNVEALAAIIVRVGYSSAAIIYDNTAEQIASDITTGATELGLEPPQIRSLATNLKRDQSVHGDIWTTQEGDRR